MDEEIQSSAVAALSRLQIVIAKGSDLGHEDIHAAATSVVTFRNLIIARHREGRVGRAVLDRANALVSLVYGAEFPLTGIHLRRIEQTRDGLEALIGCG